MLYRLYIKNYALIEELDVQFSNGLTVITGETGAGKSIIMDAMSLILGSRADTDALQDKSQKCVVEAEFSNNVPEVDEFLKEKGYDVDGSCIIRREISTAGKSRTFLNDTPTTVQLIKELSRFLIDVHSQHQTLDIANEINQFEVLDVFSDSVNLMTEYRKNYVVYQQKKTTLEALRTKQADFQKELDYNKYLLDELDSLTLVEGEESKLDERIQELSNADQIKSQLSQAFEILDHQKGVNGLLKDVSLLLSKTKLSSEDFASLRSRLNSSLEELKDIAAEINQLAETVSNDPQELSRLHERMDKINNLLSKHRVKSCLELLTIKEQLSIKITEVDTLDAEIIRLKKDCDHSAAELQKLSELIYHKRSKSIPELEKKIAGLLAELGMPHARLQVVLKKLETLSINASCEIDFLFSANKGAEPRPLIKVASGGEFSRLMLALKNVVSSRRNLQTLILDEIDAGVSGEIAGKMGEIMKRISANIQVLAITHLPQIAVKGNQHFKVLKQITGKKTVSRLIELDQNNRVEEIAKMLSGEKLTPEAIANAKVLLQ